MWSSASLARFEVAPSLDRLDAGLPIGPCRKVGRLVIVCHELSPSKVIRSPSTRSAYCVTSADMASKACYQ
jgi:hypothetical protein